MRRARGALITEVAPDGLGERLGLAPGDRIMAIDGQPLRDLLDYRFRMAADRVEVEVRKAGGGKVRFDVENGGEDLGVEFPTPLFDGLRTCRNRCVFCFLPQLPRGLRPSLYLKDDDYRLSFLHGNFITLTGLGEAESDRIIEQRLSPLYVSVHATDDRMRELLFGTPRARGVLPRLGELASAGIQLHTQVVLCPGLNDGPVLDRTLADLAGLGENLRSIGVVPVGLTRHRRDLYPLRPFTRPEAAAVIGQLARWQARFLARRGTRLVYPADEFYTLAGRRLPPAASYEGFPQLENGIGLIRRLLDGYRRTRPRLPAALPFPREVTVVTGVSAGTTLGGILDDLAATVGGLAPRLEVVANEFFGPGVTVAGLLTGQDILRALRGRSLGQAVLVPAAALKDEEDIFLDDLSLPALARQLGVPVRAVPPEGRALAEAVLGRPLVAPRRRAQP